MIYLHFTSFQKELDVAYRDTNNLGLPYYLHQSIWACLLNNACSCSLVLPNWRDQDRRALKGAYIWNLHFKMPYEWLLCKLKLRTIGITRPKKISLVKGRVESHPEHHLKYLWLKALPWGRALCSVERDVVLIFILAS